MTAVERARALGHDPVFDPPHEMSRAQRWTCSVCNRAVLSYQGNIYGSAVEGGPCPGNDT